MDKIKVYIVGNDYGYMRFINDAELTKDLSEADIMLFTGGEDVHPALYGEENTHSYVNLNRDLLEQKEFKQSLLYPNLLRLGICRGSQFLTVMNGGKLIQHVENHGIGGTHSVIAKEGGMLEITSTHHQMHYPFNLTEDEYEIIAYAYPKRSSIYLGSGLDVAKITCEPEITYYPKTNSLAIQGHPEYMDLVSPIVLYLNKLIKKYLKK